MRLALLKDGHDVFEAGDGKTGLNAFANCSPSVVVTDMIMPGMNGLETIRELKRRDPKVKIVAVSGDPDMGIDCLSRAKKLKADVALVKPFKGGHLRDAVNRCVPAHESNLFRRPRDLAPLDSPVSTPTRPFGPRLSCQFSL